jgi:putative flippase GtrA
LIATQFVKYAAVAMLSAGSDWVVFTAVFTAFGWPILAQATSRVVGGAVSFAANKYWSFESRRREHLLSEARRFVVLFAVSYILSLSLFSALTYGGVWPYWAKLLTDTSCFFFNFAMMRFWVYRRQKPASAAPLPSTSHLHSTAAPRAGSDLTKTLSSAP